MKNETVAGNITDTFNSTLLFLFCQCMHVSIYVCVRNNVVVFMFKDEEIVLLKQNQSFLKQSISNFSKHLEMTI